jgi:tetratricopeptide (TPR) repeat protein
MIKTNNKNLYLQFTIGSCFFFILLSTIWIYWKGLQGAFILDDVSNLENLKNIGQGSYQFNNFIQFITEGIASKLGRPISLLSFALQAQLGTLQAWDFKYVNLMIHLLNGCLIFWLLLYISRIIDLPEKRSYLIALLVTLVWLLHPLQISTVLYVIQRMTELSALFTLISLLIYVRSRQRFSQNLLSPAAFWIWISIAIVLGGILATLSKENGVLLVLYILVLELTLLCTLPKPRYWYIWSSFFLYLPLVILVGYFILNWNSLMGAYQIRDFTMGERLLTEARILNDYLFKILIPLPHSYGLFHDDYLVSRSLFTPISTIFAVSFVILMFIAAFISRIKYPIFAFAVLWFLAGHILESSFIGLVLYFEHRNYLPILGIIFAIIYAIFWLLDRMQILKKIGVILSIIYLLLIIVATKLETDLWSKPLVQVTLWAENHPESRFAQSQAAQFYLVTGYPEPALKYYQRMIDNFPNEASAYVFWLGASCFYENIPMPDIEVVKNRLKLTKGKVSTFEALKVVMDEQTSGKCAHIKMKPLLDALLENPVLRERHIYKVYYLYAFYYANKKRFSDAIQMANKSLSFKSNNNNLRMQKLIWLQMEKRYTEALDEIAKIRANLNSISNIVYLEDLKKGEIIIQKLLKEQQNDSSN